MMHPPNDKWVDLPNNGLPTHPLTRQRCARRIGRSRSKISKWGKERKMDKKGKIAPLSYQSKKKQKGGHFFERFFQIFVGVELSDC
jgi:hypothetical protein